jgi:heavy metal sensor kinase
VNTRSIGFRLTVWYASLLAALLALFGASVYFGLGRYLEWTLRESLATEARQIGETYLAAVAGRGEQYAVFEINEHEAPETNGRFLRVTREDGSVLYRSGAPEGGRFDPERVPAVEGTPSVPSVREERLRGDAELLIYALPFETGDGRRWLIETGAPYDEVERVLDGLARTLGLGLPLVVALAIGGGYVVMRRALNPVDALTASAERITSRNLNERLPVADTGDELERLSIALNRMVARLDEAFTHVQRFSADASHELRTPLTVLRCELESIANEPRLDEDLREMVGSALEETDRLVKIVESLLAISRLDAGEARIERARVDLGELATTTTEQLRLLAEDKRITLRSEAAGGVEIDGDRARLKQVVVNLLDNAIKYTEEGGSVEVKVSARGERALLEVADNGPGIPAEAVPHLFERFYRVDKARSRQMGGSGLGLSIVKSISAAHGGRVEVESAEGGGSRFRVDLPLADGRRGRPEHRAE